MKLDREAEQQRLSLCRYDDDLLTCGQDLAATLQRCSTRNAGGSAVAGCQRTQENRPVIGP